MDFIEEYFIDEKVCSELLEYYNSINSEHKVKGMCVSRNIETNEWEDKELPEIKECTELRINVPDNPEYEKTGAVPVCEITAKYIMELQKCVEKYIDKFEYANSGSPWTIRQCVSIQHYKPGQAFHAWHTERNSASSPLAERHLVFMTYLNTVTDKGGTEFFHQKLTVDPVVGKTLIWPADWTHTHRGIPSPTQEKTIITGWFAFY